jgi:phage shock protein C
MTNAMPSAPSDQPNPEQSPHPTQPPLRPELRRSGSDKLAGGVCGGLAEYSGIDSLLWRVGFVGLTLAGGAGVLVYLLLWVLMPPPPAAPHEPVSALEQLARRLHESVSGSRFSSSGH